MYAGCNSLNLTFNSFEDTGGPTELSLPTFPSFFNFVCCTLTFVSHTKLNKLLSDIFVVLCLNNALLDLIIRFSRGAISAV